MDIKINKELSRFREINRYAGKLINEQAEFGAIDPNTAPPATGMTPDAGIPPIPGDTPIPDETAPEQEVVPTTEDDTTEEIDITDLVNMTKSIKQSIEDKQTENSADVGKMNDIFSKLNDLEQKLSAMDAMVQQIDALGEKIEKMRPPTPVEKLEMRSLDSYPFNQKPTDFFSQKQEEMQKTGKNDYVLTKSDVENYSKDQILNSFNPKFKQEQTFSNY